MNVIGLLDAVCGVGDAARRYVGALEATSLPVATFPWHGHLAPRRPVGAPGVDQLAYKTNLLALNPDVLQAFVPHAGREVLDGRRNIGLWFWELEELHPRLLPAFELVDELWASSEFLRDAFGRATAKPVTHVPLPVPWRDGVPGSSRAALGMPDAFTFISVFDFGSLAVRKNPLGAVQAFREAFQPGEGPVLMLKTLNAATDPVGWRALLHAVAGRRDIVVLDGSVSDETMSALIGHSDCLVSLHRAEGFGLALAEAMAWGRPVIATAYSGNLDYMTNENSFLVPHGWSRVPSSLAAIYPAGARWAEPDLAAAAAAMRRAVDDPGGTAAKARRGQADIRTSHGPEAVTQALERALTTAEGRARRPATKEELAR